MASIRAPVQSSHLFRSVHNMLIFVGFCQIAVVPDSFAVSKGAVCIDKAIVLILVNLRICTDCTTQIGLVVDNFQPGLVNDGS